MLKRWTWMALLLIAMAAFWGCSDDDDDPTVPTETTFEVMAAAGAAYINDSADAPGVVAASDIVDILDDLTVIDIRQVDAYEHGHIPGAINIPFGELMDAIQADQIPTDKPIVITCYTGQSAGQAKVALELSGYEDVRTLLWGMSSWYSGTLGSKWTDGRCTDQAFTPETTNNNADLTVHNFPTLGGSASTIVAERVEAMMDGGWLGISYSSMAAAGLDNFFILNYFSEADYDGTGGITPGHIPGAYQFTPYMSLGIDQMLENLPTDMPIVVYCWTGQHSAQVAAYLVTLGYDAKTLANGSNGLFYSQLGGHKWSDANVMEYAVEVGGNTATPEFANIATAAAEYINDSDDAPGVIAASAIEPILSELTVIDIRRADAYAYSHIPGAINIPFAELMDAIQADQIPTDKPIVITCYTGQSAGQAKVALELSGYEDVKTLLWGMSSWNTDVLGSHWTDGRCKDEAFTPETTNNNGDLVQNEFPSLSTGDTLADRVEAMMDGGWLGTSYAAMTTAPLTTDDFFILNYFGEGDYDGTGGVTPGHIPGAYQFTPYESLGIDQMLNNLPNDGTPIVVYCWTGQHSAQVAAYLTVLGYNAKTLSNGSNGLFYSQLGGHKWADTNVMGYTMDGTYDD
jgi:rhodanese-related sulfurtransferase